MAKKAKSTKPGTEGVHMSRTLQDIDDANRLREALKKIPVGQELYLPTALRDEDGKSKKVTKIRYQVVAKTARMLVCQRDSGTRECFSFSDLVLIEKKYGGLVNGKSE